jgi:hypothetical protein
VLSPGEDAEALREALLAAHAQLRGTAATDADALQLVAALLNLRGDETQCAALRDRLLEDVVAWLLTEEGSQSWLLPPAAVRTASGELTTDPETLAQYGNPVDRNPSVTPVSPVCEVLITCSDGSTFRAFQARLSQAVPTLEVVD